jgi:dihydrodipicolinate synthase/N-acetylneuraminate lyase
VPSANTAAGWEGIFPSLCTPFETDGGIDLEAQRTVVRFALSCGAHGVVCGGLAGEVNKLTVGERLRLGEVIVAEVNGRAPVLMGVGAEAEHTAIRLAQQAKKIGVDGVVIPPPNGGRHSGDDVLEHYFVSVAASTDLPVVIQDAPAYLGVELSPTLVNRLAHLQSNIQYVKLEAGPEETARWVGQLEPPLRVFTGDAGLHLLGCLRAGASGNIPGVEVTDFLVAVYHAEKQDGHSTADALHSRLLPYLVFGLQNLDHYIACSKAVLVRRGILRCGDLRMPGPKLAPIALELLEKYLTVLDRQDARSASLPKST